MFLPNPAKKGQANGLNMIERNLDFKWIKPAKVCWPLLSSCNGKLGESYQQNPELTGHHWAKALPGHVMDIGTENAGTSPHRDVPRNGPRPA